MRIGVILKLQYLEDALRQELHVLTIPANTMEQKPSRWWVGCQALPLAGCEALLRSHIFTLRALEEHPLCHPCNQEVQHP